MAKNQQQGSGAVTVWMIVFVFFWLVSTVWLVIMYTGQEELRSINTRLQTDNQQLVSPSERNSVELMKSVSSGGATAVGLLEQARSETARLCTGEPKDAVAVIKTKRDELLRTIRSESLVDDPNSFDGASLHSALTNVYELFRKERALRTAADARLAELETDVERLVKLTNEHKADFDKHASKLSEQFATVESDHAAFRTEREAAVTAIEKEFDQRRTLQDADLTAERQRRSSAETKLSAMQTRFSALQEKYGDLQIGPGKLSSARQPDGRILTAIPSDTVVYVDRGEGDRLVLGMKFAVYNGGVEIPVDGKAKAQIEVVAISTSSAECRIVSVALGEAILEGDLIANPIYDPRRALNFLVLGEFDLNRDGRTEDNGRKVIESIVANWGGTVVNEVSATTDFVVVGAAPPKPRVIAEPTAEQTARIETHQKAWDRYMGTLSTATSLAVPVLSQDVFLNFLGDSARYAKR